MRKLLFATYTTITAMLSITVFILLVWNIKLVPSIDVAKLYNLIAVLVIPPVLVFFLGAYLGAGLIWILPGREFDCSPARVALGSVIGALMGIIISCVIIGICVIIDPYAIDNSGASHQSSFKISSKNIWEIILGSAAVISLLCARYAAGKMSIKPVNLIQRAMLVCGLFFLCCLPLCFFYSTSDFPQAHSTVYERHIWSTKNAGTGYKTVTNYAEQSTVIKENIGTIKELAPINQQGAARATYLSFLKRDKASTFVLEVVGEKKSGIASLTVMPAKTGKSEVLGSLTIGTDTIELPQRIL